MAYSAEVVSLLQQLRSRIFAEFGLKIRLVDPELLSVVGELGKKSRDPFTRRTVVKIMALAEVPFDIEDTEKRRAALRQEAEKQTAAAVAEGELTEITYRGNKITRSKASPPSSSAGQATSRPHNKVTRQVYRGQLVVK